MTYIQIKVVIILTVYITEAIYQNNCYAGLMNVQIALNTSYRLYIAVSYIVSFPDLLVPKHRES